jgi:hypothetical protein
VAETNPEDDLDNTASRRRRGLPRLPRSVAPEPPPTPHPVKDIVLPLAVVIGLIGNAWWGGVGWGKVSTQLETILATLNSTVTTVNGQGRDIIELQAKVAAQEKELRLFKMYTKGRIARLPYRASDDGE